MLLSAAQSPKRKFFFCDADYRHDWETTAYWVHRTTQSQSDISKEGHIMLHRTAIALIACATVLTAVPAHAQISSLKLVAPTATQDAGLIHKTGRRGRRVAAGIALGILGAAAIASQARSHHYDRDDRSWRHERRCNRWRRWCRNGEDRACWKFDNRC